MTSFAENIALSPLVLRLQALEGELTKSEAVLAQWLTRNEATLGLETGASIAARTGVSEITVSRFLRRLGYKGLTALKEDLQARGTAQLAGADVYIRLLDGEMAALIRRDAEAVLALSAQVNRPEWEGAIDTLNLAKQVFVTGFQSVKGVAEDFARRLMIVREGVQFISPHDSGLAEWLPMDDAGRCLILIDTVPYAREAETIVQMAVEAGMSVIVVTDELNTWASRHTDFVFFVASKVGTFVESTGPLASLLNLIPHAVAGRDPERTKARLDAWPSKLRRLTLF